MLRRIRDNDGNNIYYGGKFDLQKFLQPFGELHLRTFPGFKKYQFCGPGTNLEKRLRQGQQGINRLDRICRQHDIDYANATSLSDKHKADQKIINAINNFDNPTLMERTIKNMMKAKMKIGFGQRTKLLPRKSRSTKNLKPR